MCVWWRRGPGLSAGRRLTPGRGGTQPTFGGLFMAFNETTDEVMHVGVPTFNTLMFFDVSEERFKIPHVVTEVAAGVTEPRLSLTGWYAYVSDNDTLDYETGSEASGDALY